MLEGHIDTSRTAQEDRNKEILKSGHDLGNTFNFTERIKGSFNNFKEGVGEKIQGVKDFLGISPKIKGSVAKTDLPAGFGSNYNLLKAA